MKINQLTLGVLTSAVSLTAAGLIIAPTALATSSDVNAMPTNCSLNELSPVNGIVIANGKASATIHVPAGCQPVTVSLVSYSAPDTLGYGSSLKAQKLYDFQELNSDPARSSEVFSNVNVPNGCYQLDLVVGEKINSFAGGETYGAKHRLITSVNKCETTVVTPATPAPSVAPVATQTSTAVTPGMGSGPTATTTATSTITVLPQTGAGLDGTTLAGSLAGLSGLGVDIRQRLRRS